MLGVSLFATPASLVMLGLIVGGEGKGGGENFFE
jgi:hypothetical protein